MSILEKDSVVTLEQLERTAQMIALESLTPGQLLHAIPQRMPAFVSDVKLFISNMLHARDMTVVGAIDTRVLEKSLPKENYVALSEISVYVPPSMNKDWLSFLAALAESQAVVEKIQTETLDPTLRYLAALLTNPQSMASARSRTNEYAIIFHDLAKVKSRIAACYAKAGADTKVRYGDVFARNADVVDAMKQLNDISDRCAAIDKQQVIDSVNEITGALDKLLIRMKQNPNEYKPSGITLNDLSKLTMNLGHEIEFFASHVYLVQSANQAMADTKEKIDNVLKK